MFKEYKLSISICLNKILESDEVAPYNIDDIFETGSLFNILHSFNCINDYELISWLSNIICDNKLMIHMNECNYGKIKQTKKSKKVELSVRKQMKTKITERKEIENQFITAYAKLFIDDIKDFVKENKETYLKILKVKTTNEKNMLLCTTMMAIITNYQCIISNYQIVI